MTGLAGLRERPQRSELLRLALVGVALLLAVTAFRSTFAGGEELRVGVPAVLLGVLVGWALVRVRADVLTGLAVAMLVFVAASGAIAIRDEAMLGLLPTPGVVVGLADGMVTGWIRLLTSVPPAGEAGNLLAVPYLVGFAGAVLATVATLLGRRLLGQVTVVLVLATALLLGTRQPASLVVQGLALGVVLVAWTAIDEGSRRVAGSTSRRRVVLAGLLVVALGAGGLVLGPRMPGADGQRFVLRERVQPPFDPLQEPSPLAGYRSYVGPDAEEDEILRIEGLPPGVPVRLAVLDDYDGLVWRATGRGGDLAGRYERIGEEVPREVTGTEVEATIEVLDPHGVWLPTVGAVTSLRFAADDRTEAVRFNRWTDTAALPGGVPVGEQYEVRAVLPEVPPASELAGLPLDERVRAPEQDLPSELVEIGAELRGAAEAPYAVVAAMATALQTEGAFSDGGPAAEVPTPPGHSLARLARFLGAPQWVGNGEQYAAALGLLARSQGVPARVVMGFVPEDRGSETIVRASDVDAWVEVPLLGVGWVPVEVTPDEDQLPDPSVQPAPRPRNPEPQPPPPPAVPAPPTLPRELDAADAEVEEEDDEEAEDDGPLLPTWVLLAVGGLLAVAGPPAAIVMAKRVRRRRRRTHALAAARADGGFRELLDHATDLGARPPARATRREAAAELGVDERIAERTDVLTFGAGEPSPADLDALWEAVDEAVAGMRSEVSPVRRARALVSTASLRRRD